MSNDRKCAVCEKPATCIGSYEVAKAYEYACDTCCGHGNEDGRCWPLATLPADMVSQLHGLSAFYAGCSELMEDVYKDEISHTDVANCLGELLDVIPVVLKRKACARGMTAKWTVDIEANDKPLEKVTVGHYATLRHAGGLMIQALGKKLSMLSWGKVIEVNGIDVMLDCSELFNSKVCKVKLFEIQECITEAELRARIKKFQEG